MLGSLRKFHAGLGPWGKAIFPGFYVLAAIVVISLLMQGVKGIKSSVTGDPPALSSIDQWHEVAAWSLPSKHGLITHVWLTGGLSHAKVDWNTISNTAMAPNKDEEPQSFAPPNEMVSLRDVIEARKAAYNSHNPVYFNLQEANQAAIFDIIFCGNKTALFKNSPVYYSVMDSIDWVPNKARGCNTMVGFQKVQLKYNDVLTIESCPGLSGCSNQ